MTCGCFGASGTSRKKADHLNRDAPGAEGECFVVIMQEKEFILH